jgi:hypothetical protein
MVLVIHTTLVRLCIVPLLKLAAMRRSHSREIPPDGRGEHSAADQDRLTSLPMATQELRMRCQRCGQQMEMRDPEPGGAWKPDQFWVCTNCGRHFWTTYAAAPASTAAPAAKPEAKPEPAPS